MTAAAWSALAEWVTAAAVIAGLVSWLHRQYPQAVAAVRLWVADRVHPEKVSLAAGLKYARRAIRSGHPPYTVTEGAVSPEQPLRYLLGKVTETVWAAVTSPQSDLEPDLAPMRNYLAALAARSGVSAARDFAVGVLTERVRQEEDGWPDSPGGRAGQRPAHGTGEGHWCLLQRKHQVEKAIYAAGDPS